VTERPEVVLADAGYWSNAHIDSTQRAGRDPDRRPGHDAQSTEQDATRRALRLHAKGARHRARWRALLAQAGDGGAGLWPDQGEPTDRARFKLRGRAAAHSEWRLIAATHNLLKLHRHTWRPPRPDQPRAQPDWRFRGTAHRRPGVCATASRGSGSRQGSAMCHWPASALNRASSRALAVTVTVRDSLGASWTALAATIVGD
jgi:hypothetical protein